MSRASRFRVSLSTRIGILLSLPLFAALVQVWSAFSYLEGTRDDAGFVNIAGRQRMLAAELSSQVRMVSEGHEADRPILRTRVSQFGESLSIIETGGLVMGVELERAPDELQPAVKFAQTLWRDVEADLLVVANLPVTTPEFIQALGRLEPELTELLRRSDAIVSAHAARVARLQRRATYSLGAQLLLSALFFGVGMMIARKVVVAPIRALHAITTSFQGRSQTRSQIKLAPAADELAELGEDLGAMASEIERLLKALEGRRQYADKLYQSVPIGMLLLDADHHVVSANASLLSKAGANPIVGLSFTELVTFPDAEKQLSEVLESGEARTGILGRTSYGGKSDAPARISLAAATPRDQTKGLLVAIEDLTEEERRAEQLRKLEVQFREMVEGAIDCIIGMRSDGTISHFNASAERTFGYSRDEVIGQPMTKLMPERYREAHADRFGALSPQRSPSTIGQPLDLEALRKDGSEFAVELTVSIVHGAEGVAYIGVLRDATRRRAAEDALRRSEESFRALIESTPDIVAIHHDGRLKYVNPAGVSAFGYSSMGELVGSPILELLAPEDRAAGAVRMGVTPDSGKPTPTTELRFVTRGGSTGWFEAFGVPVVFGEQKVFAVFARDVSERRRIASRLMQMDRLAAVGTLAAGIGHEINNPLSYVMAHVDTVLARLPPGPAGESETRTLLSEAKEGLERIRKTVRDLRTFARDGDEKKELVDIQRALSTAESMAWNEIRHRARVVHDYSALPLVSANEAHLSQIFLNLLVNAAQAIPEGRADSNEIRIETSVKDGRVEVVVVDTGSGIPPAVLGRIFDPFFTTKPIGQGTGLGLSLARSLLHGFGGEITVESEVGRGSKFRVSLPAAQQEGLSTHFAAPTNSARTPTHEPAPSPSTAAPTSKRPMVLIVDDELRLAKAIARTLSADCDTRVCGSGNEALGLLRAGERFDALVCDLMMPEMTGMELFEKIEAEFPKLATSTAFLTGGAFTDAARAFLARVPNARLDKPFSAKDLLEIIRGLTS
ncbi:MAG: PAS domain S-box protein [Deltaproteobacteria bacterium]|nr:PAS domain S-box protein [Deltaproteobacteria bacterium]